ncbi:TPA: hypothetical protein L6A81_11925 [Pseudomonas aeruginosa]|nr:hypothetical protein [Pseudomonas aeruginosa]
MGGLLANFDRGNGILALGGTEAEENKERIVIVAIRHTLLAIHLAVMLHDRIDHFLQLLVGLAIVVLIELASTFSGEFQGFECEFQCARHRGTPWFSARFLPQRENFPLWVVGAENRQSKGVRPRGQNPKTD